MSYLQKACFLGYGGIQVEDDTPSLTTNHSGEWSPEQSLQPKDRDTFTCFHTLGLGQNDNIQYPLGLPKSTDEKNEAQGADV